MTLAQVRCARCHRVLKDPVSISLGIGPECRNGAHNGRRTHARRSRISTQATDTAPAPVRFDEPKGMQMQFHKVANLYPLLQGVEFESLCHSIKANGLRHTIITLDGQILDGRNRYRACEAVGVEPRFEEYTGSTELLDLIAFVRDMNEERRHLNESQRAVIAAKLANLELGDNQYTKSGSANLPTLSQPEAASMFNVSERTLRTIKAVEKAAPELIAKIESGEMTAHEAQKRVNDMRRSEQRAQLVARAAKHEAKAYEGFQVNDVYLGDIRDIRLPENSVDMIFTDPPYDQESVDLFEALATFAFHALKPGAYLMTYSGKMFLPQALNALSSRLEYVWMYGVFQPDSNHKIQKHHIFHTWRPITCFKKTGKTVNRDWQPDMIKGTRDKSFHEWQQQIEPALKWIEAYTLPNDLVVDPFVGGGTTLAACKTLKRNYLGFDINPETVKLAKLRLEANDVA